MNNNCCQAGRLLLPLLLLGGNVLAMDEREAPAGSDNDWSIVSAPPPPGPYRSVNIDPRIPGQDAVSVPGLPRDVRDSSQMPAETLRTPPAAGGVASEPAMPGRFQPPEAPDYAQPPGPDYYTRPSRSEGYSPPLRPHDSVPAPAKPPQSGVYAPYAQPGRFDGYKPAQPEFELPQRSVDTIPPPPGTQEDYARQPVPGPYGRGMQRPPAYNYPGSDRYPRQPVQSGYRRPPPGYYPPSTQSPLKEAPQPPIYDSMMGQPSGVDASEDA